MNLKFSVVIIIIIEKVKNRIKNVKISNEII